jgi:hypothetical protein
MEKKNPYPMQRCAMAPLGWVIEIKAADLQPRKVR